MRFGFSFRKKRRKKATIFLILIVRYLGFSRRSSLFLAESCSSAAWMHFFFLSTGLLPSWDAGRRWKKSYVNLQTFPSCCLNSCGSSLLWDPSIMVLTRGVLSESFWLTVWFLFYFSLNALLIGSTLSSAEDNGSDAFDGPLWLMFICAEQLFVMQSSYHGLVTNLD